MGAFTIFGAIGNSPSGEFLVLSTNHLNKPIKPTPDADKPCQQLSISNFVPYRPLDQYPYTQDPKTKIAASRPNPIQIEAILTLRCLKRLININPPFKNKTPQLDL